MACRSILKLKLNQRGFQEFFKPMKKLGKGTFATVFSARKFEDNNVYAIKAFSKEATFSEVNGRATVKKELEIMRCLSHKNIMKLFEVYESDNSLYVVFELLEGGHLEEKFRVCIMKYLGRVQVYAPRNP